MIGRKYFDDGSYMEWESKEGLRYVENGYIALIWLDFTSGLLSSSRVIKLSSLRCWHKKPYGVYGKIPETKLKEIIEKVKQFYGKKRIIIEDD